MTLLISYVELTNLKPKNFSLKVDTYYLKTTKEVQKAEMPNWLSD